MKRLGLCIISFFTLFFISGCDAATETDVKIINLSSYDLQITFIKTKNACISGNISISLRKGEVGYIDLNKHYGSRSPCSPNYEIEKIIFTNMNTKETISEKENDKLFTFLYSENGYKDYYQLEITDDIFP